MANINDPPNGPFSLFVNPIFHVFSRKSERYSFSNPWSHFVNCFALCSFRFMGIFSAPISFCLWPPFFLYFFVSAEIPRLLPRFIFARVEHLFVHYWERFYGVVSPAFLRLPIPFSPCCLFACDRWQLPPFPFPPSGLHSSDRGPLCFCNLHGSVSANGLDRARLSSFMSMRRMV